MALHFFRRSPGIKKTFCEAISGTAAKWLVEAFSQYAKELRENIPGVLACILLGSTDPAATSTGLPNLSMCMR